MEQSSLPSEASAKTDSQIQNPYETDALAAQYCDFHYGGEHFEVPNFPAACARICLELTEGRARGNALDIGCALGRATFELARSFNRVTGLDFSARFVTLARKMRDEGFLRYALPEEGELFSRHEARLSCFGLEAIGSKVEFHRADACNLNDRFSGYDLVLAANLIDRLYSPRRFLTSIGRRMNAGALLVIVSPYTWLEEFTAREEWLGGLKVAGKERSTLEGLKEVLSPSFQLTGEPRDIPFIIRETRRKFQHTIAEMSVWERRD